MSVYRFNKDNNLDNLNLYGILTPFTEWGIDMKKQFIALIAAIVILAGFFIAKPFVFDKAGSIETTTATEWFDDNAITT